MEVEEASCPWDAWAKPNINWCEMQRCAYVTTPANTYSNLAYVVAGAFMIHRSKQTGQGIKLFGPAAIATGVGSGLFHASHTRAFQLLDFLGMYMFAALPLIINGLRLGLYEHRHHSKLYTFTVLFLGVLTMILQMINFPIQIIVLSLVILSLVSEYKASNSNVTYKWFTAAVFLLGLGSVCSAADVTGVWCKPEHFVQGHAIWHFLTAASLVCNFIHYSQFNQLFTTESMKKLRRVRSLKDFEGMIFSVPIPENYDPTQQQQQQPQPHFGEDVRHRQHYI